MSEKKVQQKKQLLKTVTFKTLGRVRTQSISCPHISMLACLNREGEDMLIYQDQLTRLLAIIGCTIPYTYRKFPDIRKRFFQHFNGYN